MATSGDGSRASVASFLDTHLIEANLAGQPALTVRVEVSFVQCPTVSFNFAGHCFSARGGIIVCHWGPFISE